MARGSRRAERCVVRIVSTSDKTAGVGVLIRDRRILTCAHVVNAALGRGRRSQDWPRVQIEVHFPLLSSGTRRAQAFVSHWAPPQDGDERGDLCVLTLITPAPAGTVPARLSSHFPEVGRRVDVFGYPGEEHRSPDGAWVTAEVLRRVGGGRFQLDSISDVGQRIQPGYSGGPVLDRNTGRVHGLVSHARASGPRDSLGIPISAWMHLLDQSLKPQRHLRRSDQPSALRRLAGDLTQANSNAITGLGLAALAALVLAWLVRPGLFTPGRGAGWWLAAALFLAVAIATVWPHRQTLLGQWDRALGRWHQMSQRKRPRRLVALAMSLVLASAAAFVLWPRAAQACPVATELRVLTTADSLQPVTAVARAYEDSTAKANGGCPTAHLFVYTAEAPGTDPKELTAALARGWADDGKLSPLRQLGPQPDIWLPDSTLDVDAVQDTASKSAAPSPIAPRPTSIASSPIVLGWLDSTTPASGRVTWSQLLAQPDVQKAGLYPPHPDGSATGRLATLVTYASQADTRAKRDLEQRIDATFSDRGIPQQGASGTGLLCLARRDELGKSGVIIAAKDAWSRYHNGLPLSANCGRTEPLEDATGQVLQPTDTVVLDHPFVSLTWTRSPKLTAARDAVLRWLLSPPGQQALRKQGLDAPPRVPATQPTLRELDDALRQYHAIKPATRILLAVDTSGSMNEKVAGGTRFDVVKQGVQDSLDQMGPKDRVTLWGFSGQAHRTLISQAYGDYTGRQRVIAALRNVPRSGATPLHPTITAAVTAANTVVVLTDGEDTTGLPASNVAARVKARKAQLYVVATGEARCGTGPLQQIAGKLCYQADLGNVDRQLANLFATLWGGK